MVEWNWGSKNPIHDHFQLWWKFAWTSIFGGIIREVQNGINKEKQKRRNKKQY